MGGGWTDYGGDDTWKVGAGLFGLMAAFVLALILHALGVF